MSAIPGHRKQRRLQDSEWEAVPMQGDRLCVFTKDPTVADCDAETNAILAEHLYQAGTEKMLQDFAHILKESILGERIKAVLAEALSSRPVTSDERPHGSCSGWFIRPGTPADWLW